MRKLARRDLVLAAAAFVAPAAAADAISWRALAEGLDHATIPIAGRIGDGLITVGADDDGILKQFSSAGGEKKPTYVQITVCWANAEEQARQVAREIWPVAAMPQPLMSELALPSYFEAAAASVLKL